MNDTTKKEPAKAKAWQVTFKYVNKNALVRAGNVVVNAVDETEAKALAQAKLATSDFDAPKVINAKIY